MAAQEPDVLIVGAGPAGVVAALLLGDLGVRTLLIDKRTEVSTLPRAKGCWSVPTVTSRGAPAHWRTT
jgi:flavin-dependent dehydrogenase